MEKKLDDFEAVRTLVEALKDFEKNDQERIIRWAREKIGLPVNFKESANSVTCNPGVSSPGISPTSNRISPGQTPVAQKDIRTFVESKRPNSDNQFVATVAYYHRFESPENERKEVINANDLIEACRTVGRDRMIRPSQTLINSHNAGYLDKAGDGFYRINAVGENLVAMALPDNAKMLPEKKHIVKVKSKLSKNKSKRK